jgi:capsular polysaccharide transport system permease protein
MTKDTRTGRPQDRTAVAKNRDKVVLVDEGIAEPATNVIAAPIRPRRVEAMPPGTTALSAATDRDLIDEAETIAATLPRRVALPRIRISPLLASFVGCVLVPAFVATVYFAFIASDQLAAEARFAVRSIESDVRDPSADAASGSSSSSGNFSFTATGQNAYIVTSYIRSRAIVDDLNAKLDLREMFRRPEADFWARLKRDASIDELTEYWNSMIATYIDAPSGIVTFQVRAFRRDDALTLGTATLELSETLVNRISVRARRDAMEMSEKEVRRTYALTQAALADMRRFRDTVGIIDPAQATTEIGKLLLPLLAEKIRLESDLFVASRDLDDSAPTIRVMKSRIETTERQIAELKGRLTRTDGAGQTVASSLVKFEELEFQRQFAEKLYTLAQADLDRARLRADRQSVYLTVFVPPSLPEESRYPRRAAFPLLIFLGLAIVWSIVVMIFASVEDHRL